MLPVLPIEKSAWSVYSLNEQAVTIEFGNHISEELFQQVNRFHRLLCRHPFPGLRAAVPAYATLSVFFDPLQVMSSGMPGTGCFEKVSVYLKSLLTRDDDVTQPDRKTITIPVCYGGTFGPDLEEVARLHDLTSHEVVSLHSSPVYTVYMIGFTPGFAYLGGLPGLLETARKPVPRKRTPAGSVGIAGKQTGVYPLETPGGWQLIGRTPLNLFDPGFKQPALLSTGNQVIFKPIDRAEFDYYKNESNAGPYH